MVVLRVTCDRRFSYQAMCHPFVVIWSACVDVGDPLLVHAAYRTRSTPTRQPLETDTLTKKLYQNFGR